VRVARQRDADVRVSESLLDDLRMNARRLALVGAGGPIIGRRADVMIIDDAVDEPTARRDLRLKARVEWVQRSVRSRLNPSGLLVAAGTMWDEGDVISSLSEVGTYVNVHDARPVVDKAAVRQCGNRRRHRLAPERRSRARSQ
jgi:hypothetical protein